VPSSETRTRRAGFSWLAIPVACLACAIAGGVIARGSNARTVVAPPPDSKHPLQKRLDPHDDEVRALRADVARLSRAVGAMSAQPAPATSAEPSPQKNNPIWAPMATAPTQDDVMTLFESSPANVQKTRALSASLDERLNKESFASARVKIDEVDCRGETCRARVSFADDAQPEPILLELAGALPDSHSFQEAAPAPGNRRTITSHYIDEAGTTAARPAAPAQRAP
jgi:hypothetical protein